MNTFHLQIVTPDGLIFDGQVGRIIVRTTEGDVGILSGHADYVTPLDTGMARITMEDGEVKTAACSGGLLSVKGGITRLVGNTFEWAEDIDVERAKAAKARAEQKIKETSDYEERAAEIKLKRALTRIRVGENAM
jgi:F-type H+-transporting ATPase subunit epsilon